MVVVVFEMCVRDLQERKISRILTKQDFRKALSLAKILLAFREKATRRQLLKQDARNSAELAEWVTLAHSEVMTEMIFWRSRIGDGVGNIAFPSRETELEEYKLLRFVEVAGGTTMAGWIGFLFLKTQNLPDCC